MILYIGNPKDSSKKLLQLINNFSKVAGYKISMQKSVACLYTNSELSEKEIKKIIPYTMASKTMKYLGINLTKEMKDLYTKNCKMLRKEIEKDTDKWKDSSCSCIGRVNIMKMSIISQRSMDSVRPYQNSIIIFHRNRKKRF